MISPRDPKANLRFSSEFPPELQESEMRPTGSGYRYRAGTTSLRTSTASMPAARMAASPNSASS